MPVAVKNGRSIAAARLTGADRCVLTAPCKIRREHVAFRSALWRARSLRGDIGVGARRLGAERERQAPAEARQSSRAPERRRLPAPDLAHMEQASS